MNSRVLPPSKFAAHIQPVFDAHDEASECSIGQLISAARNLTPAQVDIIVAYQRRMGIRFGEAAIALGFATSDDVLRALSRQFEYAYSPELASNTRSAELIVASSPFSDEAEAFRELRSQLLMGVLGGQDTRRALSVLSPDVGDGKTYVAANLAVAFSQLGDRTLLVDADMRTPRLHRLFGLDNGLSGLSNVLSARVDGNAVHRIKDLPHLYVMPVGAIPPNPLELLQHPAFGMLLLELLSKFDHVVVDTPAAVHGADARVIAAHVGAALVIGRQGRSRVSSMKDLLRHLSKGPGAAAGVVMNDY